MEEERTDGKVAVVVWLGECAVCALCAVSRTFARNATYMAKTLPVALCFHCLLPPPPPPPPPQSLLRTLLQL